MKMISCAYDPALPLSVQSFGREDVSEKARWGRGVRNVAILHWVLAGEGVFNGNRVSAGEGFCILPGQLHEYHSSQKHPWKYVWVTFGGEGAKAICTGSVPMDERGIFPFEGAGRLESLFAAVLAEPGRLSAIRSLGYLFLLFSLLERKVTPEQGGYVQEGKKYMELHLYRKVTVREVAAFLGISDRYFYNLFVESEGISPKQYLGVLRLSRAKELLRDRGATVSEVAISCGFSDVLSFSRFFSKKTGLSPTAWRQQEEGDRC